MIFLDTSVALAQLIDRDRFPPTELWDQGVVASRLLQYEAWVVLHARGLAASHGQELTELLGRIAFLELDPRILARAMEPFPLPVRTLDALHLASLAFLRDEGLDPRLASYDDRMVASARRMRFGIFPL